MAFYCIDYNNGSDVTGDGTALAPWATIAYGEAQINGGSGYISGDEMRIAGSTLSGVLDTNMVLTNSGSSSATISTNINLTGQLAVGDYVQLNNSQVYPSAEINKFTWCVKSITGTSIEIFQSSNTYGMFYRFPDSGTPVFSIQKISDTVVLSVDGFSGYYLDRPYQIDKSFEPFGDNIIISGGWDSTNFTSKTNLERTVFGRTGTYQATAVFPYGGIFQSTVGFNGIKFQDINISRVYIVDYLSSGVWNYGFNLSNLAGDNLIVRNTGTQPATFLNERIFDNISMTRLDFNSITSETLKTQFNNGFIQSDTAGTFSVAIPFSLSHEITSFSGNTLLLQSANNSVVSIYNTSAGLDIRGRYVDIDWATTTFVLSDEASNRLYDNQGQTFTSGPTTEYVLNIPDISITSRFRWIFDNIAPTYNYTVDNLDVLPGWSIDQTTTLLEGALTSEITETSTGLTYNFYPGMYTTLNNVNNSTGTNCIEFRPYVVNNNSTGNIVGNWMPIVANKGQVINISISARILGSTTSLTPPLKLINTDASTYGSFKNIVSTDLSIQPFTLTGGSLNNTTYTELTYQVTVLDNVNFISNVFSLYWDIPTIAAGDRLLVDKVTYTIA
jgi:hypothetical protein